jgi:hypothetical protein
MIYLYRHIRLDKNEPFYIGIGEDKITQEYQYVRAHDKTNRSKWWKDIAKNGFNVEIILQDIPTWDEACLKETEFISLYGRSDRNLGSLCNMTDGGEGFKGPRTEENKQKLRKPRKEGTGDKIRQALLGKTKGISNVKNKKPKPEGFGVRISTNQKRKDKLRNNRLENDWLAHKILDTRNNTYYKSFNDCCRQLNIRHYQAYKLISQNILIKQK